MGPSGKLNSLQALRGVAVLLVVQHHALAAVSGRGYLGRGTLNVFGVFGVDLFFVISGFIIARTALFTTPQPTAAKHLWRRWYRVTPLFWLMSLPWIAAALSSGQFDVRRLIATIAFWPVFRAGNVQPFLDVGWTLTFEMAFYVMVGGVLLAPRRWQAVTAIALIAILLGLRFGVHTGAAHLFANPIMLEFAAGAAVAALAPRLTPGMGAALVASAMVVIASELITGVGSAYDWRLVVEDTGALTRARVFGIPAALLVAGCVALEPLWRRGLLTRIGDASYSIYLSHTLVTAWVGRRLGFLPDDAVTVALIVLSCAFGWLVYVRLETPLMRARPRRQ